MSWASKAGTDFVTYNDLAGSGLPLNSGQSHGSTDDYLTKDQAIAKYSLNTGNSFLAAKAGDRIVAKRDLEAGDPATATLTITFESGKWYGYLSAAIPSASVMIEAGVARGYYDACLGAPDETVDMWSDAGKVAINGFPIPAGELSNDLGYGGYDPYEDFSGSVINYNMIDNVEIDGVARTDGSTFYVGATLVTLSLPLSCTPYS